MQCERCTKKKATVFYRENVSGRIRALRLCADCADLLEQTGELEDMSDPLSGSLFPLFPSEDGRMRLPFRSMTSVSERDIGKKCPLCSTTLRDICDTGTLGCSQCYVIFSEELEKVIKAVHGGTEHRGRISSGHQDRLERIRRLQEIRKQLKEAVTAEAYETAAKLRDEIRGLEAIL